MSFKLRPRRGTASQWSSANPVLDIAEIGLEMGSENRLKFGTGSGAWNSLPYLEGWTQGKFDAAFAAKNTDALSEGATNLYFSQAAFDSAFAGKTTDDLPAGSSNLYFTDALFDGRFAADFPAAFDTRLAAKSTSDLAEGANLYYTAARFDSAFAAKTTANLTEGANLYYTDARARAAFSATAPVALSAGVISMPASTNSVDGYLTSADHTTFAAKESALTFSSPLSRAVNTISIAVASASVNGYLSSSDFSSFAAKVSTSRSIATTSPVLGGGDLSADRTISLDFTTAWTWTANGIAATPTDRIILSNTMAAISGTQQYSPAFRLSGQAFDTTLSASKSVDWRIYVQPLQGATAVLGSNLLFQESHAGGAFSTMLTIGSQGNTALFSQSLGTSGSFSLSATGSVAWSGRGSIKSSANGVIELYNSAANDFTRLNFGSTGATRPALAVSSTTLKCRLADDSADAPFTAKNFACDGTGVGFNGSATTGKSSAYTVTNQTASRTLDVSTVTLTGLANNVAAIIADLKTCGLFA